MTCAEFQKVLPYIIETGGNAEEEEHLRTCQVCSDLVTDLRYIVDQAKLLVPMEEPNPRVWDGIRGALEREDFIGPARRARRGFLKRKGFVPWVVTLTALLLATTWHFVRRDSTASAHPVASYDIASNSDPLRVSESDDLMLLSAVEAANPAIRALYTNTLQQVNQAISELHENLRINPENAEIRQLLASAYRQKAMLYNMAVRSLS